MKCHTHDHQMSKGRERERARHQRHLAPCYFSSWCCEIARLQFAGKDATHVIEKLMASLEKAKQERRAAAEALALAQEREKSLKDQVAAQKDNIKCLEDIIACKEYREEYREEYPIGNIAHV
mmetsp:Transcript_39241/g.103879  ORF Transcript_39241/g.103879 Transcript_39241/m.103879 type:complete len:122 (+) Transcript_39241:1561-1926(+)